MPWLVRKTSQCPASSPWGVILQATGKVIKGGCHDTEAQATAHQRALYANTEPDDTQCAWAEHAAEVQQRD